MSTANTANDNGVYLENSIIRFAGDSGDGIQTTGAVFSHEFAFAFPLFLFVRQGKLEKA